MIQLQSQRGYAIVELGADVIESPDDLENLADAVHTVAGSTKGLSDALEDVVSSGAFSNSRHDVIHTGETSVLVLVDQLDSDLTAGHLSEGHGEDGKEDESSLHDVCAGC